MCWSKRFSKMEIEETNDESADLMNLLTNLINENSLQESKKLISKLPVNSDFYRNAFLSVTLERKEIFRHFIQKMGFDLNILNKSSESLLHKSLKCSDEYFLTEILKRGIDLEQKIYKTILHNAVALDKPSFVEPLLKYGVPMINEDIMGMTPLDIAIENRNYEIVSMFLYFNCDTFPKSGNISPFMYSMLCDSDLDIQLLLLEYETDMNNSDLLMNNLFIAIERCQYLIPHILKYGADVNQICCDRNIIEFILDHPLTPNLFEMIWQAFTYETWESTVDESILIVILNNSSLENTLWNSYLRIIIESFKINVILDYETHFLISLFVEEYIKKGFSELDFYDLICLLLVNGCPVYSINLHKVYNLLGNASLILKLLIHMDIERTPLNTDFNFIRVRYNFDTPVNRLLRNFLFNMRVFNMTPSYKDILRYFTVPPKVKDYLQNHKSVTCPFQITWDHVVPSLIELSRNEARHFICKTYLVKTGSRYCSIVNHCALPKVVKDILMFERPLYFDIE